MKVNFSISPRILSHLGEDLIKNESIALFELIKNSYDADATVCVLSVDSSFIEESEPGDLAFFDNDEGNIVHVGIMMEDNYIIHASGKVRIDRLDHLGIYNADTNRHTHKLRVIKKII